jgi:hypothetical protein
MRGKTGSSWVSGVLFAGLVATACEDNGAWMPPTGADPPAQGGAGGGTPPAPEPAPPSPPPAAVAGLPPPISGGTLLVLRDGGTAVASDPDRDFIYVVDLLARNVRASIDLAPRSEPGRAVEDADGRVHVALRGAGVVLTLDPADGKVLARRALCPAPRGLAFDPAQDRLHVACAGGELIAIGPLDPAASRIVRLDRDLRDVIVRGDKLLVSTFRTAELLVVGADGLEKRLRPRTARAAFQNAGFNTPFSDSKELTAEQRGMASPAVAWRMVAGPGGQPMVLHQRGADDPLGTEPNAYGGGPSCAGVVEAAVSTIGDEEAGEMQSGGALANAVVPVDMAVAPDGQQVAVVAAGHAGTEQQLIFYDMNEATSAPPPERPCVPGGPTPKPGMGPLVDGGRPADPADAGAPDGGAPAVDAAGDEMNQKLAFSRTGALPPPTDYRPPNGEVIAVAFDRAGNIIVQSREPATLQILTQRTGPIVLSYQSRSDQGHQLFHGATSGKLACASCHPEGGEDARVWRFVGHGERRTQSLRGGIMDTAPFHWSGDQPTLEHLMSDVFQGRMGGARVERSGVTALGRWLDQVPVIKPSLSGDAAARERGRALFENAELACTTCHRGADYTSAASFDVGTGGPFQVPQLHNLAFRAPFLHDGCAGTLLERFTNCGGGDRHGLTSKLSRSEIDDLVAYLESL